MMMNVYFSAYALFQIGSAAFQDLCLDPLEIFSVSKPQRGWPLVYS